MEPSCAVRGQLFWRKLQPLFIHALIKIPHRRLVEFSVNFRKWLSSNGRAKLHKGHFRRKPRVPQAKVLLHYYVCLLNAALMEPRAGQLGQAHGHAPANLCLEPFLFCLFWCDMSRWHQNISVVVDISAG